MVIKKFIEGHLSLRKGHIADEAEGRGNFQRSACCINYIVPHWMFGYSQ